MIAIEQLCFGYPGSDFVLRIPDFQVASGEKLAIVGPSGAGKTTFLKLIAGIAPADGGCLRVDGAELHALGDAARRDFRARRVGFVFQELELLDYLDVFDNIVHAYRVNPSLRLDRTVRDRAKGLAEEVGLGAKLKRMPRELSQGERQRVAVCRALLPEPSLILADEATGNLDPANKVRILDLRIDVPDLRPQPRVLEKQVGEIPQRVAALHRITCRRVRLDAVAQGADRDGRRALRFRAGVGGRDVGSC